MLNAELKAIIPSKYRTFEKLERGDPYNFDSWRNDTYGNECLYYWFYSKNKSKKNQKRVVVMEIVNLLRNNIDSEKIKRLDFKKYCPTTLSAGPCGYAVTIRLLEYLGVARYLGRDGVQLINKEKIKSLI